MMQPSKQLICKIPADALEELVTLASNCPVPGWDFTHWPHGTLNLSTLAVGSGLGQFLVSLNQELCSRGFVIADLAPLINTFPDAKSAAATTLLLSALGSPLQVFLGRPHWRRLTADLSRPPERSGGVGCGPLHMDFVNAEIPPDLICLLCLRPDPLGGGKSLVARTDNIEQQLDLATINALARSQFRDGEVVDLSGVGRDANPFPVLSLGSPWKFRFTGNLLHSAGNVQTRTALAAVSTILNSRVESFTLARGDLLILDQHRVVHARGALGKEQEMIAESERRLLLQSYVRQKETDRG